MYIAKANARTGFFNMLTGNEDVAQIYSYVAQNPTKYIYKELIKFRKRANYLEMLIYLMHKALAEELTAEVNEWASDTLDWLDKRNASMIGQHAAVLRKPEGGGAITVAGNADKMQAQDIEQELAYMQQAMLGPLATSQNPRGAKRFKPKIKKVNCFFMLTLNS
jgi:hypothetical protein